MELAAAKKSYGPEIPGFRFSDNVMGAQKPRDNNNYRNNNDNDYAQATRTSNVAQPLPPQALPPISNNNEYINGAGPSTYAPQYQQQQQPPPPPLPQPPNPPAPAQVAEQKPPAVYNDFSEYERQLRQFTKGH
jgi:hypothetical protein